MRTAYLRAVWAGHLGEADFYETRVDQLLSLWDHVRRGVPLIATEETLCD